MPYVALYRKYRPRDFDGIVGQKPIITTLTNQIKTGKIGHAYLFCGMRGTGKTSTARVFAKALNCEHGPTDKPCGVCGSCTAINQGTMMDVIEMDAASNRGIDDIRDLREKVNFPPATGSFKVYIIDEVHMLTAEAFNALLKTLEEPPGFVVFILATTEPSKLPATILSRCMRFDFTRVPTKDITESLGNISEIEGIRAEKRALSMIAAESQGSMRDALSLLDKAMAFGGESLSYDDVLSLFGGISLKGLYGISRAAAKNDSGTILGIIEDIAAQGKDMYKFMNDLLWHYRDLIMINIGAARYMVDAIDEDYAEICEIAKAYTKERLLIAVDILQEAAEKVKWAQSPRVIAEASLLKLTVPNVWDDDKGYIARIQELETQVEGLKAKLNDLQTAPRHVLEEDIPVGDEWPEAKPGHVGSGHGIIEDEEPEDENPEYKIAGYREKGCRDRTENPSTEITFPPKADGTDAAVRKEEAILPKKEALPVQGDTDLKLIQDMWGKITSELAKRGKRRIQSYIDAGGMYPHKIEGVSLILCYNGNSLFKEGVENARDTLEAVIKEATGRELKLGGFVDLEKQKQASREAAQSERENGNAFVQRVIDLFGEDIVEIQE